MKWGWKRERQGKTLYLFGKAVYRRKRKQGLNEVIKLLQDMKNIHIPAAAAHPAVFRKYKNCLLGKDLVFIAAGPTLDKYTPLPGAVHMGVNRTYQNRVPLDYHVALGFQYVPDEDLLNYRAGQCTKFYGYSYEPYPSMHARMSDGELVERFYFTMHTCSTQELIPHNPEYAPIMVMESVVTGAMQIALWMHPRRIYLVGCDSDSSGYFSSEKFDVKQVLGSTRMRLAWERVKEFADDLYPDVEIISINPRGLRGLFRDQYMVDGELTDTPPTKK